MPEFVKYPKTPRLVSEVTITEKIDGTNSAVVIEDGQVYAQSRNRFVTPESDNFGFAAWAMRNAPELVATLGDGVHFGEWWGSGIQRAYGLKKGERFFSLFNRVRWAHLPSSIDLAELSPVSGLLVVPMLIHVPEHNEDDPEDLGATLDAAAELAVNGLKQTGSFAAPGFMRPEGVIAFHHRANRPFKLYLPGEG